MTGCAPIGAAPVVPCLDNPDPRGARCCALPSSGRMANRHHFRRERSSLETRKPQTDGSFGKERQRDLNAYHKADLQDLRNLLATLQARAAEVLSFSLLWARLASRIARACKQIGIRRVSLYTTRHVGMANAKSWMSPAQVAASAGHKTTATATSHYAKRRSGWGSAVKHVAGPSAEDVKKVILSPKWSRDDNLKHLANEQLNPRPKKRQQFRCSGFKKGLAMLGVHALTCFGIRRTAMVFFRRRRAWSAH